MSKNDTPFDRLLQLIAAKEAKIAVVGLGYVGLPLAKRIHGAGFSVTGFDIDKQKVVDLQGGVTYLKHLGKSFAEPLACSESFIPTNNPSDLANSDVIILCLPTPLDKNKNPDMQYVESSAKMVSAILQNGQLVVLESTTWPGTTRELMVPLLEKSGLICGEDFFVGYSPEREDPGRTTPLLTEVPKVVSGLGDQSLELTDSFYSMVFSQTHKVSSVEVAESSKLLENIYRSVNIALVNEMKVVLEKLDIDIWEVIKAASTKPFGFTPFYPGPGLGGHCIPIDPFYMSWKARQAGTETRFIELAGEINRNMPNMVVEKVLRLLSETTDPSVLILGVAYKPNVDDIREAPSAEIISQLQHNKVSVSYHDPHCPAFPAMKRYDINLDSVPLTNENLSVADLVLIVTHHDNIDWEFVGKHSKLIVDTRNVMNQYPQYKSKVIKA